MNFWREMISFLNFKKLRQKEVHEQGFSYLSNTDKSSLNLKRVKKKSEMSSKEEPKQQRFIVFSKRTRNQGSLRKRNDNRERQ